ncbi:MAG TPA: hypothetical protein VMV04_18835 [Thermodesulfobacteriota bacterium]|nr:hypothetical protein [Thermodesulfobacteriota bacterium]
MITPQEEAYVSERAYVPEHIVNLMEPISKGEPFLKEEHLGFTKDNWLILVGYPLDGDFSQARTERVVKQVVDRYRPELLWFIGPEILPSLLDSCKERETDRYYTLAIEKTNVKPSLQRVADKASKELTVERSRSFSREHEALISELLKREKLPPRVRELYRAMPYYVVRSSSACVLNGRDKNGKLCAFFVVELGAKNFSAYVLGSHSKKHYVPHASDLLFYEMIKLTREHGKHTIHLGLGVNAGIKRFKEKWGGIPSLSYEFCERDYGTTRTLSLIKSLEGKL